MRLMGLNQPLAIVNIIFTHNIQQLGSLSPFDITRVAYTFDYFTCTSLKFVVIYINDHENTQI
jgi:hypothetical protein